MGKYWLRRSLHISEEKAPGMAPAACRGGRYAASGARTASRLGDHAITLSRIGSRVPQGANLVREWGWP